MLFKGFVRGILRNIEKNDNLSKKLLLCVEVSTIIKNVLQFSDVFEIQSSSQAKVRVQT